MKGVRLEEQEQARVVTEAAASRPRLAKLFGKVRGEHILYVASLVGMILLWHVIATTFFKPQFFPSPLMVLATGREMVASRELFEHIGISLQRILTGFLIGSVIAAPTGLIMGSIRTVRVL